MPEIQIIAKDNHKTLVTTEGTSAKLSEASVVLVKVAASDVLVVNREGTNAVIRLKNGETIVIEGFFSGTAEPKDNSLVFQDENGQLIWAKFKDAENDADADSDADADADSDVEPQALLGEDLPAALPAEAPQELVSDVIYQPISSIEPLLYDDAGVNPWLWAAIPLVAGGIIAAASNHDSNDDSSTPTDTTPPATPSVPSGYLDNVGPDQGIKGSGSSTDDTTPGVVISAPGAGETPTLYVDGEKVAASYDPVTGTLTPTTPLADGSHQLTYTLTDAAGNESAQSPAITVTVDTLAPATPSVPSGYLDNVGPDQGIKGSGSSTDDTTPGVVISAPGAGETPTLYVDGEKVAASYDPVTGTLTPTTPLADGSHQLTYTLTDAAGNESAQSPAITVTVDTLAPATPSVPSGYLDNVGPDQGIKGSGSSTDDTTPGVVISAPGAGETPTLYVDGEKVAASYDPVTGTLTPTTPLADGSHQLTYTLTDAAGNESAQSPAITVTVDTLAPATPSVPSGYLDNVGPDQGIKGSGSSTDDTTPGVVISAPGAGETPTLYVDGEKVAASYDPVTGTLTPTTPLADGSHQLTYTLTDAAGNESAQSPAITVTVDTLAPATPSVPSGYLDNVGPDQGIKGSGSSTDDTTPGVVISAPGAGETPTLYVDGEKVAASYDPVTGTLTPTTPLADGSHQLTYTLTDAAGNESAQSPAITVTVDTLAPATPSVPSGYLDNVGPDQGIKGSGSSTDDTTPGVVISAPGAGETPTLYVDGEKVAASYDPVTGTLTPTTPLADGSHQLTYTLTDAAGNESAQSPAITVTVDTLAPATPSVPSGYLDNVGPDQGIKGSGSSTDDTTPGVVISAPGAGETPTLYVDGEKVAASYDPVTGTLTPTTPLADGSHQLTYTLTDAAGNESAQSPAITVTVDTLAPATPSVPSGYLDNVGPDQGIKGSGSSTDDTTPGVVISAPGAGETPTLYVDGEKVAASYDPVTGTLTPTTPLADGSHQLTYTLTDAAGNESAQSPAITVTVDTTAPVLTISTSDLVLASGEAATITFEFSEPVSEFSVSDVVVSGGVLSNFIQVDANTWTAIFTQSGSVAPSISVADGAYTDIVGNTGKGDVLDGADGFIFNPLAVDLIGEITIPADINNDNILNANELGADKTFTAQITLGSDAAVGNIISVNGINYTVVQADLDAGFITAEIIVTVDGDLSVRAEARDSAGNTDIADTTIKVITVDTTAPITPSAPTGYLDNVGPDQGIKGSGSSTDDTTPGVVISAPGAGETPTLYVDGEKVAASYDPVTGTLTPTTPLADGSHQLTYTLTDAAGNESVQSPALLLTVDTTAPSLVITALDPALTATESTTISFTFSEAVSGFDIDDITPVGGTLSNLVQSTTNPNVWTATFTADGSGAAPSISVADGAYTDLAGNLGTGDVLDGTDGFVVDTLAPAPVITIDPVTNAITIDFGEAVNAVDGSPLTADALEGLLDIANGTLTGLVDNGDGSFSGTLVPAADFEGDVVVNVPAGIVTDVAGNANLTATESLTVDTLAPGLVITALDPALTATESTTISFTFSEAVSGFDIDDITPVGGTLSNLVQSTTNPNVWTATFTADGSGAAPSISVADGAYTDLAGNLGTGDVLDGTDGFVVDTLAPAPVITIDPVTNAITIDFGEAVNAVDGSPLTADALEGLLDIANGTLTGLVDNGDGSFSGTLVPAADFEGDVVVNVPAGIVTDVAGNANLTATESLTVDTLAPGLVITALDPALTATESTTISFTFSEAVSGFDIDDITPVGGTLSNLVQSTTNPNVWTATFTADGSGAAPSISVADGAYTDLAGNLGTGDVLDGTDGFVVDTLAPAPVITIDPVTNAITIDFGEAVNAVDGSPLTADALEGLLDIANGTLTGLVDNGDGSFSGTLVPAADFEGDVVVNVPAGIVTDVAGNANLTATESLTVDTLAPTLVISATDTNLSLGESTTISFTFSEAVSGFDIDDITPVGGTLSNLVQSTTNPNVWTATFTQDGTLTAPSISVADDAYTDLAGNLGKGDVFDGTDGFVVNTIDAINDNVTFDPGTFVSTIWDAPIIAQDINVLDTSIIGDTSMNVEFSVPRNSADIGTGHEGDVVIQVSQDNLIAVASGFSVLVEYFDGANWVQYTTATTTNGGLIADALGLGVLGIVDDGKTIAVHLTGVPEGQYRVVVQNDSSAIGDLLDDLTLAQLGDQGILLGADNQDAVLDAVETALNGQVLNLGTLVRNVLEPLLNIANAAGETLAVTDIVAAIVKIPLVGSLLGGVDTVLDYIADALVDNLLSVLEFTNVTINGSETYYTTPQVSGNVFDDNGSGADDRGNSDAALVTKVDGVDVPTDGTDAVIKGLYGTLYINKDGVYRYVLNGSVDSNGQVDDFTYTLSDGTHSDTAVLTISVADVIAPKAPIVSSLDETTVTGVAGAAEANSVINVYGGTDSDGDGIPDTLLGTTTANPDGSYTVTLNPAIALGDTVVVTSKDAAGNISTPTIASLHNIVALDDPNQTNYELSTTADRPNISGGIFTLANAGVLGDLIDLDLSATSAPGVTVGTNEQITLTLTASGSTGLDISAVGNLIDAILGGNIGGSLDLIIAKQTSTGSYEVYNTIANAYTLNNNVLTFTASGSQSISLDDAGVYKFILAPNSSTSSALSNLLSLNLLGNLILSSNDVVATINNTDLITGNVLSNDTAAPIGLDLSIVSIKETTAGVDETVVSGTPKVIEGMYGTLTIDSTGAYSYQMTANATALGKVEAFTYTVQDNDGHSKQATIYIRLDSNLVTLDWTGKTGLEEANKLVTQLTADNKASAGTVTTLFDQVLNGSGDSSNSIQVTGSNGVLPTSPPETGSTAIPDDSGRFTLGAGQTAYISFTSILPSNVTQDFGFLGGGNQTSAYNVVIELERDGGTLAFDTQLATWTSTTSGTKYYYKVTNTGNSSANYDLNIGYGDGSIAYNWTNTTGKTFGINNIQLDIKDTTYTASSVSGDLISNDILYSSVFKIGVAAGSTTPSNYLDANSTPIVGAYGTLTVNLDGTYSYQANGKIADLGKDDVFTYKIETLDGTVNTQTLTIKVDADNVLIGTPDAGTTGNDIAVSQSANEVFTLGDGADLLIYNVLNGSSPTGGNGTDQWLDFNMSEGDKIDVSSLLSGATTDNINNYLSVSISGNQVTLLVDRDGSSGGISTPTALLTLTNEDHATNPITSLVDLLNNNSIIY
ncbi:Ig-like domain-containing protein [Acinetobacter baumannii]